MLLACGPLECITNCLSLKIMKEYRNINLLTVLLYAYYLRWMGSVFNVEIYTCLFISVFNKGQFFTCMGVIK